MKDRTVMLELDREDHEYIKNRIQKLEEQCDMLIQSIVSFWKDEGKPEPNKPHFDQERFDLYKDCDDQIIAQAWLHYNEDTPIKARGDYRHYNGLIGRITELKTQVNVMEKAYEEKTLDEIS